MRRCVFVLGTRAQLVKVAPVLRIAADMKLPHSVWFTGQHHESIDDLIADFSLRSEFVLPGKRMERSSILRLLRWIPSTLYRCVQYISGTKTWTKKRPLVVVHGDTLSTWLGALAARWGGGDVVHLESGLSSGKWSDPFPEELLRRLTFRMTRYALCPNDEATARMQRYPGCIVVNTRENTLLDCVRFALEGSAPAGHDAQYFVASIHRFQNIYKRAELTRIVDEMITAAEFAEVLFILHPPTELRLKKYGFYERMAATPGIRLLARKSYTEFLGILGGARAVFSDGGSNQEELSYLGVPTLLYRERSERPDGLGVNIALRPELKSSMRELITSGELDGLRRRSRIDDTSQPSQITVDALSGWAGNAKQDIASES